MTCSLSSPLVALLAGLVLPFAAACAAPPLSSGPARSAPSMGSQHANTASTVSAGAETRNVESTEGAATDERVLGDERTPRRERAVGDFVVFRFSGSYRKAPVVLTERVVAKDPGSVVLEVSLSEERDDGTLEDAKRVYRVTVIDSGEKAGSIEKVARVVKGKARPDKREAFESFIAQTALSADENEGAIGTEKTSIDVSGVKIACDKASYRVRIGKKSATLSTLVSEVFAWSDVGGEIRADDGKVIYKAELVKVGHADAGTPKSATTSEPAKAGAVASVYDD